MTRIPWDISSVEAGMTIFRNDQEPFLIVERDSDNKEPTPMTTEIEAAIAAIPFWKRPIVDNRYPAPLPESASVPEATYNGIVYLGGPVTGKVYDEARYGWRQLFVDHMPPGITCLSPMRQEGHLIGAGLIGDGSVPDHPFSEHDFIFTKDVLDIQRCDVAVFNFLDDRNVISKGSLVELGIAYGWGKSILVGMGSTNIHQHVFVREAALVFPQFSALIEATKALLSEGV